LNLPDSITSFVCILTAKEGFLEKVKIIEAGKCHEGKAKMALHEIPWTRQ
jgi:hypothetical protein